MSEQLAEEMVALLASAVEEVSDLYFQLPVAGQEQAVYRERVYCYELYHQWRKKIPSDSPYSLCGELDKAGHPLIRRGEKPDFLVHVPGNMDNLLAVEVKPARVEILALVEDYQKLSRYTEEAIGYLRGVLLIYGGEPDGIGRALQDRFQNIWVDRVAILLHQRARHPPVWWYPARRMG